MITIYLDMILELLEDSRWHNVNEIKKEIILPPHTLDEILYFLHEQAFIDKEHDELRIAPLGLRLLELPY